MSISNIYDLEVTEQLRRQHRLDPQRVREFRTAACKRFDETTELVDAFPQLIDDSSTALDVAQRCDSRIDGATKLLLRTRTGMLIETVILRIATGRTTLCVSSQVGCGAACDFCATGKMGVAQNLTAQEILEQVRIAGQMLAKEDRKIRNVVFMGMGEPFHNQTELFQALELLTSKKFFNLSPTRLLVSTVGVADAMLQCAERFPEVNIALSLHSTRQDIRERIIPLAKKWPLDELRATIEKANAIQQKPIMLEYLLLAELNDSVEDAQHLANWARGLNVHLNLIPFNPIEDAPHLKRSDDDTIHEFSTNLKESGLPTTVRYSLGADIAAACGQLVQQENRRLAKLHTLRERPNHKSASQD